MSTDVIDIHLKYVIIKALLYPNMIPDGTRILFFQQRGWAINIGHFLAKKFQEEGCELAALTFKKSTHAYIIKQKEVNYKLIINNDEIMIDPKKFLADKNYSLEEICEALGVESIWPFVESMRNYVRSYREKFYYGFKQNLSDEKIIDYIMAVYKCIKIFFNQFNPQIIISPNFVALPHIMFNLYASKKGVKMIGTTDTKIKGYNMLVRSFYDDQGSVFDRINELNEEKTDSPNRKKAKQYIQEFRNEFKQPDSLVNFLRKKTFKEKIKKELAPYYRILQWYIKGPSEDYLPNIGPTPDYRPPKIILRDHYYFKKYKKFAENFKYYPLEKAKKYVYFPLQFQPESSMDVMAPFFNNQLEIMRQVAMAMPGDYTLVVKEHPAMVGYRTPSYIEKMARTVNVKLINYRIPNVVVLKNADIIISPNSTSLAEAAFLCVPGIQLGNLGITLKLPNIFKHTDMPTLTKKIKEILSLNLKNNLLYEKKLENFVAAVFDAGFNIKYNEIWEKGSKNKEELWMVYKKEVEAVVSSFVPRISIKSN